MLLNRTIIFFCWLFTLANNCFAQQPKLVLPIGHTALIISAAFSADGTKILTGSGDCSTILWDANTATTLANFKDGTGYGLQHTYFSPDGKNIVTMLDKKIIVRDALTTRLLKTIPLDESLTVSSISPDGTRIIGYTADEIKIIDAQTGAIQEIEKKVDLLHFASVSFDNKLLATTSELDSTVQIWDIQTGRVASTLKDHTSTVNAVVFSRTGQYILTVSYDHTAKIWDARNGRLLHTMAAHTDDVKTGSFSPDETMVITGSQDGTAKIWNTTTGSLLSTLSGEKPWGVDVVNFSPDNRKVLIASGMIARIWDVAKETWLHPLKGHTKDISNILFSPDQKNFLTVSDLKTVNLWDIKTGLLKNTWSTNPASDINSQDAKFSPDGKRLLTIEDDAKSLRNTDAASGKLLFEKQLKKEMFVAIDYSPDGKKIVAALNNETLLLLDAATGAVLHDIKDPSIFTQSVQFSPDSKLFVSASWDSTAKIWDAATGEMLHNLSGHADQVSQAAFSADGKKIITVEASLNQAHIWDVTTAQQQQNLSATPFICFSADHKTMLLQSEKGAIIVWDIIQNKPAYTWLNNDFNYRASDFIIANDKLIISRGFGSNFIATNIRTGEKMYELESSEESKQIQEAAFSANGNQLLTRSYDNTCKIWNSKNGSLIYTFFIVDNNDYFVQIPSGYYQATSNAAKRLHYVTKNLKVINFEQLDTKYNRPDKVLQTIGNTDTALINSYRKAYEKRIQKLGIDTTAFRDGYSVPEADFVNRNAVAYELNKENLTLHIKGVDSSFKLDRFNIWVNEVPEYGQRGISIRNKNANSFDSSISIKLSQGENQIECSIINVNGTESYRMPLLVNYVPAIKQKETTHFIGIGIDQFANPIYNLQYSVKDIRDLAQKLKEKYGSDILIDTLFNQNVVVGNIKSLRKRLLQTAVNDKIIIAYSGHGMLSKDYDYYLSTYDGNFENPQQNALPYDELENLLDSIPARKKLLLIDACHSGEVDKEELEKIAAFATDVVAVTEAGAKGVQPLVVPGSKKLGMKNSFELMQELFVNVGRSTGATVISAAAGTQFALERGDLKNGVFTYSILEFMKTHPTATLSELKKYVNQRVPELTKGMQVPTSRTETNTANWNVW